MRELTKDITVETDLRIIGDVKEGNQEAYTQELKKFIVNESKDLFRQAYAAKEGFVMDKVNKRIPQ